MKRKLFNSIIFSILFFSCDENKIEFHKKAFIADTHNDVLLRSMIGQDILTDLPYSHSDLFKFKNGEIDLQVFSIWVSPYEFISGQYFERANQMISQLEYLCSRVPKQWSIPYNYQDIIYNEQQGILSCMIGVEGGHAIENDINKLNELYSRGMRYLGVTWNNSNDWATSAKDEIERADSLKFLGLSKFGESVIKRCNELGVMIDVSHAGEKTFWDIINITKKPIIASHSSVYKLCPHFRNLKDEQIMAIKENGGVIFVNFYPGYIDSTYSTKAFKVKNKFKKQLDSLAFLYNPDSDIYWYKENQILNKSLQEISPNLDDVIDHIDYIVNLIGIDHVGIGADWDGVEILPNEIENISKISNLTRGLFKRGYNNYEIQKILGENFKRVFKENNK